MNTSSRFRSPLASHLDHFLVHHRALGKRFDSEESALRLLDRFIFESEQLDCVNLDSLTPTMLERFLLSRQRRSDRSYNHLRNVLQRFFKWCIAQQLMNHTPVTVHPRRPCNQRRPYLFDRSAMERLLLATGRLRDAPHAHHRGATYRMIFALMFGVGLRVSEVANLCHRDLNFQRQYLHIQQTKFSKNRLVPFGPKMAQALQRYIDERTGGSVSAPDDPVFSLSRDHRQPITSHAISSAFRQVVDELSLAVPDGVSAPRLHCLRHSFAVSTLVRWYRSGIDPAGQLMHLSTFMGHVNPSSTAVYLTITVELLELASDRFQAYAAPVLPRIKP